NPSWIAIGMAGYLAFIVIRGWRWLVILRASAPAAALGDATAVTAIGFALNAVSPFKLGELLRIGAIAPRARIGVGEATATVVLERVLDVLALLVIALAAAAVAGGGSNSFGLWSSVVVTSAASLVIGAAASVLNHVGNIAVLLLAGGIGALWLRVRRPAVPVGLERPVPS